MNPFEKFKDLLDAKKISFTPRGTENQGLKLLREVQIQDLGQILWPDSVARKNCSFG
jgi:hypothetical protein